VPDRRDRRDDRQYPARPIVGLLAVVERDGRFLLVRRGKEPNRGAWGFPGGVQELGETVFAGALRELLEETGIVADAPRFLTSLDVIQHDAADAVQYHYTLIAIAVTWIAGDGKAADDADAVGWYMPDEMQHLPALPGVEMVLKAALTKPTQF